MAKAKAHMPDFYGAFKDILDEFQDSTDEAKERGLTKAADYLAEKYRQETPVAEQHGGATRRQWVVTTKYKGVRYINNTHLSKDGIPVANLLEFSKNGKPFIRRTFEREKGNLIKILEEELKR